jgi:hypothetical protein
MPDIYNLSILGDLPNSVRYLLTVIAGLLPVVLGVILLTKCRWYSGRSAHIVAALMSFFLIFNCTFVGLLLNPRPGRLPWYEDLLIAFLFALAMSGLASTGWAISRFSLRRNDDKQKDDYVM